MVSKTLGPTGVRAMEKRGLNPETAAREGIYTGSKTDDGEVVPDDNGNILVFPIIEAGVTVGEKYRGPNKTFWQKKGSKQTFIGGDILDEPVLRQDHNPRLEIHTQSLVIVEGEPDWLTALDVGALATSVPAGAPPPPKDKKDDAGDEDDSTGKFEFMWHNRDRLKAIKRFIIAVDNDANGKYLADELVRRLGASRCYFVVYPAGCKDLNDVMMTIGRDAVHQVLRDAKPYPLKGLYSLNAYPDKPQIRGLSTGWDIVDTIFTPFAPSCTVVTGMPGSGKALALDTPVPTLSGWSSMGDLRVGDVVFDERGQQCRVTRVSNVMVGRPCFRLTFDDGTTVVADAEHQWLTSTDRDRRSARIAARNGRDGRPCRPRGTDQSSLRSFPAVVTTNYIAQTLIARNKVNHQIPLAGAVVGLNMPQGPVDPYLLGVWLGDGTSANGCITCFDLPIIERIVARGDEVTRQQGAPGRYNVIGLKPRLRLLGLLDNKHIPPAYLRGSPDDRLELLRGLMDTDGYCCDHKRSEFTTISERLARDVLDLVNGLGFKATVSVGDASLNGRIISKKYRVGFTTAVPVFALDRKSAKQPVGETPRVTYRGIVACEQVESVPVRCIQVDSPSHLFLVTRAYIATHNSTWLTNLAINMADKHGWKWAVFSPELPVVPHYRDKMRRMVAGESVERLTAAQISAADRFINEYFVFIDYDQTDVDDSDLTLQWLLDRTYDALMRFGIRGSIYDPWNEVEHDKAKWESTTEYTNRALRQVIKFGRRHGLASFILAHPTKDVGKDGKPRVPTLYDIDGSAAFFNKPDFGLVVHRPDPNVDRTELYVKKVRFEGTGNMGKVVLSFNRDNSRFEQLQPSQPDMLGPP